MGYMSNFSRHGAVDLSKFTANAEASSPAATYVMDLSEQDFEATVAKSMQYPVVLVLHSGRDTAGKAVVEALTELANAAGGKWLLAKIDVDEQPRIGQALGVKAVPTVIALLAGQAAPLFQGTRDKAEISALISQIEQVALANGLTGRAEPVTNSSGETQDSAQSVDPRFIPADEAMEKGDFATAVAEFDKLLADNPADSQAKAGRAQAALLDRTANVDEDCLAKADALPQDIELALVAADIEVVTGQAGKAFDRLLALVRTNFGENRERLRLRLLELFETLPSTDPQVKRARRELSLALF